MSEDRKPGPGGDLAASPTHPEAVCELVRSERRLLAKGNGTKPSLSHAPEGCLSVDMTKLSGISEYAPEEYTLTVLAGTTLAEINGAISEKGQFLPFDPPLAESGATIGGTVAAGLSGSGRLRFGGLRDFILGVRFVTGNGVLVRGGGKVVKNAAGFDLPKLIVGSMGRLGILIEINFKVFPEPPAYKTLKLDYGTVSRAQKAILRLNSRSFDLTALEMDSKGSLYLRMGGPSPSLPKRLSRLEEFLGQSGERLEDNFERAFWRSGNAFRWAEKDASFIKVPLTPGSIPKLDPWLAERGFSRRYSAAGNIAWLGCSDQNLLPPLNEKLKALKLPGVILRGKADYPLIGHFFGQSFLDRIKKALDPQEKFLPFGPLHAT